MAHAEKKNEVQSAAEVAGGDRLQQAALHFCRVMSNVGANRSSARRPTSGSDHAGFGERASRNPGGSVPELQM